MIYKSILISLTFLFSLQAQAQNYSKQCTNVDARSVKQVQTCIASSSNLIHGLDAVGKDFSGCGKLKMNFSLLTGVRPDADSEMMPDCHVFSKVLYNLNGKQPVWSDCIDFAENQTSLSRCYASLKRSQRITNTFEAKTCTQVKRVLMDVVIGVKGAQNINMQKMPGCEQIASVMRENNHEMSGYACGKYKPDSQQHINACLHSYFAAYKYYGMHASQTCDQLRRFYHSGVASMHDGEKTLHGYFGAREPSNFQVAQCPMLEAAVASYNEEDYKYESFNSNTASVDDDKPASQRRESVKTTNEANYDQPRRVTQPAVDRAPAEESEVPTDAKSLLKQMAIERAGQSKTVNKTLETAAEYESQYEEVMAEGEEYVAEEEEDLETLAKKKVAKKLFDKLGL